MIVDPASFKSALKAHARTVRAWDPDSDPDGGLLQVTLLTGCTLARALEDHQHLVGGTLEVRKFPDARDEPDWAWRDGHKSSKHGRFMWSCMIHAGLFVPDAYRKGFYFAQDEDVEHLDADTVWFVTLEAVLKSWGVKPPKKPGAETS